MARGPLLAPRKIVRRAYMEGRPRGQWYSDLVGKVKGYPKTQEAWNKRSESMRARVIEYNKRGISRKGVPDGWGRRKKELLAIRAEAQEQAKELVSIMVKEDVLVNDDPRAVQALETAVEIMTMKDPENGDPIHGASARLSAAKILLEYLKAKPAQTVNNQMSAAEDFLRVLAERSANK